MVENEYRGSMQRRGENNLLTYQEENNIQVYRSGEYYIFMEGNICLQKLLPVQDEQEGCVVLQSH